MTSSRLAGGGSERGSAGRAGRCSDIADDLAGEVVECADRSGLVLGDPDEHARSTPQSERRSRRWFFSTTLSAVRGSARLVSGGLAEEIERLRAEPAEGDIAIGGATLAA